jgi:hypothetical protein
MVGAVRLAPCEGVYVILVIILPSVTLNIAPKGLMVKARQADRKLSDS